MNVPSGAHLLHYSQLQQKSEELYGLKRLFLNLQLADNSAEKNLRNIEHRLGGRSGFAKVVL